MGDTRVKVGVLNLTDAHLKAVEVECIVDTGATLTVIPAEVLAEAKVQPVRKVKLHLADGREIIRNCGHAVLLLDGERIAEDVVFGEKDDPPLLGVRTLEGAALMVDPESMKLVKKGYYQHYSLGGNWQK